MIQFLPQVYFMYSQEPKNLNESPDKTKKEPFFCSLCSATKNRYEERVKCPKCARLVCKDCFESLNVVGLVQCPFCSSSLKIDSKGQDSSAIIANIQRGQRKVEMGDLFSAEAYFQNALKLDSNSIIAWKKLGILYFKKKNWERAKFCFSKVLKVNSQDEEAKKMYIEADHRIRSYY